jgi:glycosyltransferase involved in cell wall biosynthesis
MKKIIILSTYAYSLLNIRGDMMAAMAALGHQIIAAAPEDESAWSTAFQQKGFRYIAVPIQRTGLNPFKDIRTLFSLYRMFRKEKPDVLFAYQAKAVAYGCLAAKLAGVREIFSMIAGLGSIFQLKGIKGAVIRSILVSQYKAALACCQKVFFQNPDDAEDFVKRHLVKPSKAVLVHGSGVNMVRFCPRSIPSEPVFLFVGRLLRDKGLLEYLEAARLVKKNFPGARFMVLGSLETNPMAVSAEELAPFEADGSVELLGFTTDVRPYLEACSVFVLPSYREGTSRAVLEALAMGRPVITTDAPGCRETVRNGINGWLVPVRDAKQLAEKMAWMIQHPEEGRSMGQESLRICRERFDVNEVNRVILKAMGMV